MLVWPFCVDMNRAEEVQLFRKSREVSLRSNGSGSGAAGPGSPGGNTVVLNDLKHRQRSRLAGGCVGSLASATGSTGCSEEESNDELQRQRRQQRLDGGGGGKQDAPDQQVRPPNHHRRMPRFGEAHHRRVPTPLKKRRKPREDFTDPPTPSSDADDAAIVEVVTTGGDAKPPAPPGVPDPYYPIYLPIDQAFKAKYVFHQRKGKTFQEKVYVFLEHPCGWICFIYHFAV